VPIVAHSVATRLGNHVAHNLMIFTIVAVGPLAFFAAVIGLSKPATWQWLFAAAFALVAASGLLHDDVGIHEVGPIHWSETVPLVLLLAVAGFRTLHRRLAELIDSSDFGLMVASYSGLAMLVLTLLQGANLRFQAFERVVIFEAVDQTVEPPALVIGDPPMALRSLRQDFNLFGAWVHHHPPPDPFFRDPVIYARRERVPELLAKFPDRNVYRLVYKREGTEPVEVIPVRRASTPVDRDP
jgi:hypothetical protein